MKFDTEDLDKMLLAICEFCESRCSESLIFLVGVNGITFGVYRESACQFEATNAMVKSV
jgi:hypothetical protein